MTDITLREFLINYLQVEYGKYSKLIFNQSEHIDRCHLEGILTIIDRNQHMKVLNDLIKSMNSLYNERLKILKGENVIDNDDVSTNPVKTKNLVQVESFEKTIKELLVTNNYASTNSLIELMDIWETLQIPCFKNAYYDDFSDIKEKLLKVASTIGFYSLDDALTILISNNYQNNIKTVQLTDFKTRLDIYNRIFIPLSYEKKVNNNLQEISSKFITSPHDILLENFAELSISFPFRNETLVFTGMFKQDPINAQIRTSQICKFFIYDRKKKLIEYIANNKTKFINDKFKSCYVKALTAGEILSYEPATLYEKLDKDFETYSRLAKLTFKNLMNDEFVHEKANINTQYQIIKLFLIGGTDENVNMAGLLFGLTKDKKIGNEYIANIIYKNLNYNNQTRLRKSTVSIKAELDKLKNMSSEDLDINKQLVASKNIPTAIKKIAIEKSQEMKNGGSEFYKQKTYLDIVLNFPWPVTNIDDDMFKKIGNSKPESIKFLNNVKAVLDNRVYGHNECKSVMQELIGKWLANPKSVGKSIALVGPPGVGKTLIAKALGDALMMPFTQINLGGMEDRCILSGHSYTYSAAQPGLIVRKMVEAGNSRCIMYFDELDKACTKHGINEIFNVLIHVTDTNTNDKFNDSFFNEITFPLNKVLFVFSYNDGDKIDKILLDRMEKINVSPYTVNDKLVIVKQFLLKEICQELCMDPDYIAIKDDDIEYIIEQHTMEAGVRDLKRKLETIYLKMNLDKIYGRGLFEGKDDIKKIDLTRKNIDDYLKKPQITNKKIHDVDDIGVINGLYATSVGSGGIIPILIYSLYDGMKNKFNIKITGSQGNVMKESVSFAFTTAMNLIKIEFRDKFLADHPFGLHIHTPDGATPKDGPSAGVAFTTAFISRILGKKIKRDVAMTGEIEINGKITAIGGLVYKLKGAQKANVKTVFVPSENKDDLNKILETDKEISNSLNIIMVSHIREILELTLIEENVVTKGRKKKQVKFNPDIYLN